MSFKTAFFSFLERETSHAEVEAYAHAQAEIGDLDMAIQDEVAELRPADAGDAWEPPLHQRQAQAFAWIARALASIVSSLTTIDEASDGEPAGGYLSIVTYTQARDLYVQVPAFVRSGWGAVANPSFESDVGLPLSLAPRVPADGKCPLAHLRGMKAAADALDAWLQAHPTQRDFDGEPGAAMVALRDGARAACRAASEILDKIESGGASAPEHAEAESHLWEALGQHFLLGQLRVMPALAVVVATPGDDSAGRKIAREERWYLTSEGVREDLENTKFGEQMIESFWSGKEWQTTAREERYLTRCEALLATKAVSIVSRWPSCPFDPVYVAEEAVCVLDVAIARGQEFHLDMDQGEDVVQLGSPQLRSARGGRPSPAGTA